MRTLAIGDIHGCYRALTTLADFVPFRPDDLLVTLGDYVNRGPQSKQVLDWLIARQNAGTLIALRGNHEVMTLVARVDDETFRNWLTFGGQETLASYASSEPPSMEVISEAHWRFLEATKAYFENESHLFVHANAHADSDLEDQPDFMLYWERFDNPPPHCSGKIMICGHTSQKSGRPLSLGHAVCIDTWAYGDGWLTCLDVQSGQYWQANQRGETRTAWLEDSSE